MGACTQKSGFFCIYMAIAISEMKRCEKIKITIVVELKLCLLYNDRNIRSIKGDENLKDETVKSIDEQGEIVIYQSEDGKILIDVKIEDETVWLTQQQMADLFQTSRTNVVEHIKHIYEEQELEENATCRNFRQVRLEGNREVKRNIPHYNLDMIISLGYRVKSIIATQFRRWVTERIKEYIIKGFTMDDERLKSMGGGNYWKELLDRIRDICSSEKVLYRQVLNLYTTSADYNSESSESIAFFKMVQNKY